MGRSTGKCQAQLAKHGLFWSDGISAQDAVPLRAHLPPVLHRAVHAAQRHPRCERRGGSGDPAQDSRAEPVGRGAVRVRAGPVPAAIPVRQTAGAQGGPSATPAGETQATCQGEALVGGDWKSCF